MRSAIIKKARLDEIKKQQQTITSKTLYPFRKLNNKVKIASDKTETKDNNLYLFETIWHQSIIRLGSN